MIDQNGPREGAEADADERRLPSSRHSEEYVHALEGKLKAQESRTERSRRIALSATALTVIAALGVIVNYVTGEPFSTGALGIFFALSASAGGAVIGTLFRLHANRKRGEQLEEFQRDELKRLNAEGPMS